MQKTSSVRAAIAAIFAGLSMSAHAIADTQRIDIPAGSLLAALETLAKQASVDLVYQHALVEGLRTGGVSGELSPHDAVVKLLQGTPLQVRKDEESGAILIMVPAPRPPTTSSLSAEESAPRSEAPQSFWSRLRVAQSSSPSARSGEDRGEARTSEGERAAQSPEVTELEEIVITGSRIRGAQAGAAPSYSFDRRDFNEVGASTVQDVMRTLPQNFVGGNSEFAGVVSSNRNGNSENITMGSGINLRGLGNGSTLVLLNGRRLSPGGLGQFVDVSTIPLSAIERIDVVPDGASAIYGSDAVGGVVNFILRDDFRGAETTLRYGTVTEGSLRQYSTSQLFGGAFGNTSFMAVLDYSRKDPLLASERSFASALAAGNRSDLTTDDERYSVLATLTSQLTSSLELSILAYANDRDSTGITYNPRQFRPVRRDGESGDIGGTATLDWTLSNQWQVSLSHTYATNESDRENRFPATATLVASSNRTDAEQDVSVSELDAEGALMSLPGGDMRLAIGGEYRRETLDARTTPVTPRRPLERDVSAGYAELFVPLIGEGNARPLAQRLDLTAALRYEDYSDVGSTDNIKLGLVYEPFDGVRLRGTYGTSFRAPYLNQYDMSAAGGIILNQPSPNGPVATAIVIYAPAPDLGPETATTWSAGFDFDPSIAAGFRLGVTYFDVDYTDRIYMPIPLTNMFTNPLLTPFISQPPDPAILALIPTLPTFVNTTTVPLNQVGATFDARTQNQASTRLRGVDVTLGRSFDLGAGSFDLGLNGSYLLELTNQQVATVPGVDVLDTIFNPVAFRARGSVAWRSERWSLAAFVNYTDSYRDNQIPTNQVGVSSWTTLDLSAGYKLGGWRLSASVNNVFDEEPPAIIDRLPSYGNPGYDTENANPLGRLVVLELVKSW